MMGESSPGIDSETLKNILGTKDPTFSGNYCPISLLSIVNKIACAAITKNNIGSCLIHKNQYDENQNLCCLLISGRM